MEAVEEAMVVAFKVAFHLAHLLVLVEDLVSKAVLEVPWDRMKPNLI